MGQTNCATPSVAVNTAKVAVDMMFQLRLLSHDDKLEVIDKLFAMTEVLICTPVIHSGLQPPPVRSCEDLDIDLERQIKFARDRGLKVTICFFPSKGGMFIEHYSEGHYVRLFRDGRLVIGSGHWFAK